jgi:hypothetical protein
MRVAAKRSASSSSRAIKEATAKKEYSLGKRLRWQEIRRWEVERDITGSEAVIHLLEECITLKIIRLRRKLCLEPAELVRRTFECAMFPKILKKPAELASRTGVEHVSPP